ncbi:OmpP1/FadL family transporter [Catenovulum maritimum]|uniref:Uncharacterized protein n=1 Tax=Catenovulum maritimum TaxID=1513271 RepID=A0A0J8GZJ3_9ALTE|nr:outer membrane protein transport protein [Catenovulum maritimum]KMT66654.1 hypothetical protein XM47_00525 [Catenovulum maritimum]
MKKYLALMLVYATQLTADEFHNNNLLVGGESISLGGAYTALSNDLSVMHYNPAGLTRIKETKTASVNTVSWERTEHKNVFSNGNNLIRDSLSIVPGFFGIGHTDKNWAYGLSFGVIDYGQEKTVQNEIYQVPATQTTPAEHTDEYAYITVDNISYQLTLATALKLSDTLSIGTGLGVQYRDFRTLQGSGVVNQTYLPTATIYSGFDARRRYRDQHIVLQPSLGLLWKKHDLSFGLNLSKDIAAKRNYDITTTILVTSPTQLPSHVTPILRLYESSKEKQKFPLKLSFGGAYKISNSVRFSLDVHHFKQANNELKTLQKTGDIVTRDLKELTNFAFGTNFKITKLKQVYIGFFTDKSNGIIDTNIDLQRVEDIDLKGVSLAYKGNIYDYPFTIGGYYKWGEGRARYADLRVADTLVGIPLYPNNVNNDIAEAEKRSFIGYISLDF